MRTDVSHFADCLRTACGRDVASGIEAASRTIDLQPGELLELKMWARNESYVAEDRRAARGTSDAEIVVTGSAKPHP